MALELCEWPDTDDTAPERLDTTEWQSELALEQSFWGRFPVRRSSLSDAWMSSNASEISSIRPSSSTSSASEDPVDRHDECVQDVQYLLESAREPLWLA